MILYSAYASWDDGQICANGYKAFGLFAHIEGAKAACEADGALPKWEPSRWRENTIESQGEDGWKAYYIKETQAQE